MPKPGAQERGKDRREAIGEPSDFGADSVRAYLRDMGGLRLLNRAEEVKLAMEVEEGERVVLAAILDSSMGVDEILRLGVALKNGTVRAAAILRDAAAEGELFDEELAQRELLGRFATVARLCHRRSKPLRRSKGADPRPPFDGATRQKLLHAVEQMRLSRETIARIERDLFSRIE